MYNKESRHIFYSILTSVGFPMIGIEVSSSNEASQYKSRGLGQIKLTLET